MNTTTTDVGGVRPTTVAFVNCFDATTFGRLVYLTAQERRRLEDDPVPVPAVRERFHRWVAAAGSALCPKVTKPGCVTGRLSRGDLKQPAQGRVAPVDTSSPARPSWHQPRSVLPLAKAGGGCRTG